MENNLKITFNTLELAAVSITSCQLDDAQVSPAAPPSLVLPSPSVACYEWLSPFLLSTLANQQCHVHTLSLR